MMTKRPLGVSISSMLCFLSVGWYLVLLFLAVARPGTLRSLLGSLSPQGSGPAPILLKLEPVLWIYFSIMAVAVGAIGYGMWSLRNWARLVIVALTAVSLIVVVISFATIVSHIDLFTLLLSFLRLGLCLLVLGYLFAPGVRAAFRGLKEMK